MKTRRYKNYTMEELRAEHERNQKLLERARKYIGEDVIAKFEKMGLMTPTTKTIRITYNLK